MILNSKDMLKAETLASSQITHCAIFALYSQNVDSRVRVIKQVALKSLICWLETGLEQLIHWPVTQLRWQANKNKEMHKLLVSCPLKCANMKMLFLLTESLSDVTSKVEKLINTNVGNFLMFSSGQGKPFSKCLLLSTLMTCLGGFCFFSFLKQ